MGDIVRHLVVHSYGQGVAWLLEVLSPARVHAFSIWDADGAFLQRERQHMQDTTYWLELILAVYS